MEEQGSMNPPDSSSVEESNRSSGRGVLTSWILPFLGFLALLGAAILQPEFSSSTGPESFIPLAIGLAGAFLIAAAGKPFQSAPRIGPRTKVALISIVVALCTFISIHAGMNYDGGGRPLDFDCYASAWRTAAAGCNPYSPEDTSRFSSLSESKPYPYIYSPAFLLLFEPMRFLSLEQMSLLWTTILAVSGWLALVFTARPLPSEGRMRFLLASIPLLLVGGPIVQALRWGNTTPFIALFIVLMIRNINGLKAGFFGAAVILQKLIYAFPIAALRTRRAFVGMLLAYTVGIVVSSAVYEPQIWLRYIESLSDFVVQSGYGMANNLSLMATSSRIVDYTMSDAVFARIQDDIEARMAFNLMSNRFVTAVFAALSMFFLCCVMIAIVLKRNRARLTNRHIAAILSMMIPVFAPVSWNHYGILVLPFTAFFIMGGTVGIRMSAVMPLVVWVLAPVPLRESMMIELYDIVAGAVRPAVCMLCTLAVLCQRKSGEMTGETAGLH